GPTGRGSTAADLHEILRRAGWACSAERLGNETFPDRPGARAGRWQLGSGELTPRSLDGDLERSCDALGGARSLLGPAGAGFGLAPQPSWAGALERETPPAWAGGGQLAPAPARRAPAASAPPAVEAASAAASALEGGPRRLGQRCGGRPRGGPRRHAAARRRAPYRACPQPAAGDI
ncbi:unnamed protein product, partial [Prorocentrum cordatum]